MIFDHHGRYNVGTKIGHSSLMRTSELFSWLLSRPELTGSLCKCLTRSPAFGHHKTALGGVPGVSQSLVEGGRDSPGPDGKSVITSILEILDNGGSVPPLSVLGKQVEGLESHAILPLKDLDKSSVHTDKTHRDCDPVDLRTFSDGTHEVLIPVLTFLELGLVGVQNCGRTLAEKV